MSRKLFVNLPVTDLGRSRRFYEALGFHFDPQFTDDAAACMVISEHNYAMLLTHEKFRLFTPKPIADAKASSQVLVALSCEDRAAVDAMVAKAVAAGGSVPRPAEDHGFMYGHAFEDPDGHIWEPFWMAPEAAAQA
ncbi:VOC family protein [Siccirubricoccus phaeus]|uniref:VOC family protein n=1 Tax=Siccirubricoccus phaeus TaxID=2595053 RepID=UPI0011F2B18A|nr:VOC family protein [Siccirubricoccus phaeus]